MSRIFFPKQQTAGEGEDNMSTERGEMATRCIRTVIFCCMRGFQHTVTENIPGFCCWQTTSRPHCMTVRNSHKLDERATDCGVRCRYKWEVSHGFTASIIRLLQARGYSTMFTVDTSYLISLSVETKSCYFAGFKSATRVFSCFLAVIFRQHTTQLLKTSIVCGLTTARCVHMFPLTKYSPNISYGFEAYYARARTAV